MGDRRPPRRELGMMSVTLVYYYAASQRGGGLFD
jgi:hypothetical protein